MLLRKIIIFKKGERLVGLVIIIVITKIEKYKTYNRNVLNKYTKKLHRILRKKQQQQKKKVRKSFIFFCNLREMFVSDTPVPGKIIAESIRGQHFVINFISRIIQIFPHNQA